MHYDLATVIVLAAVNDIIVMTNAVAAAIVVIFYVFQMLCGSIGLSDCKDSG